MIKNLPKLTLVSTIACGLLLQATPASANRTITCKSHKGRYNYCQVDTRGGVKLSRQISDSSCRQGRSGSDTAAILGGALVVGAIDAAIASGSDNDNISIGNNIICNSRKERYTRCNLNLDRYDRIRLKRQLSNSGCWQGDTWGYDRDGIWVDRGCRGEFEIMGRTRRRRSRYD